MTENEIRVSLGSEYKDAKRDRRRKAILDAAAAVFAKKGYFAATMQDIADRLGMRPASLYYYFTSKEAALEEVCRLGGYAYLERLRDLVESERPVLETIEDGIRIHLDSQWRDHVTSFAFNRQNLPDGVLTEMNTIARDYTGLWKQVLERGSKSGALDPDLDADFAARAILSLCNGAAGAVGTDAASAGVLRRKVLAMILSGVGKHDR